MHQTSAAGAPQIWERHEAKYRIRPEQVAPIRATIARYCAPDKAAPDGRYRIVSLYLDSPSRLLYRETRDKAARRFKLRIRRYVTGAVHLEIKRRVKGLIAKSRVSVAADLWPQAFHDPRLLSSLSVGGRAVADDFINRCLRLDAQPAVLVGYSREAWSSEIDDYARATFDSGIQARAPVGWTLPFTPDPVHWQPVDHSGRFGFHNGLVLELKSTPDVPLWMVDLVHRFGLKRTGFSKYGAAIDGIDRPPSFQWRTPARRLR